MKHLGYILTMQLLLLCSAYVIYFQSTGVRSLEPQKTLKESAPADRLVIFMVDGLDANSFFANGCKNVRELSKIYLNQGQVGIVHSSGFTNCRTAQLAIFSGFYKNPVAVVDNWNDTVFAQSSLSYAWGSSEDLKYLPIVNKRVIKYSSTFKDWVSSTVDGFLDFDSKLLQNVSSLLLVVHLPKLPVINGENMKYTYHAIWRTYNRFEQTYPNQRTAYLLYSHTGSTERRGMFSCTSEMETPFVLWGAGVSNEQFTLGRTFVASNAKHRLPLSILEPIQLTPLISALLGLPPPVRNRGQLPLNLLNTSSQFGSHALFINTLQLVALAKQQLQIHSRGLIFRYMKSHTLDLQQLDQFAHKGKLLWNEKRFLTLQEHSSNMMPMLLQCIEYYENYYRLALRLSSAFSFLGWQHYLRCQKLSSLVKFNVTEVTPRSLLLFKFLVNCIIIVMITFLLLQRVSWLISAFILLPGCVWKLALNAHQKCDKLSSFMPLLISLCLLTGFFDRRYMAVCYLVFALYHNGAAIMERSLESKVWITLVFALTCLSLFPSSLGFYHRGAFTASILLTLVQPIIFHGLCRAHRRNMLVNGLVILLATSYVLCVDSPQLLPILARVYVIYVFYPKFGKQSHELVIYNLSTLYTLLSTSHEAILIQLLALELQLSLRLKNKNCELITRKQTISMYMLVYSLYSFFIIGNVADIVKFHSLVEISGLGAYSTFMNGLAIAMKLCVPLLLMHCIISLNCEAVWVDRFNIFYKLLTMCNGMALISLFRLRDNGSLWENGVRIVPFVTVQILPFVTLLLITVSSLLLGTNRSQILMGIRKGNVHLY